MKKLISLTLAILLIFSLVSCNNSTATQNEANTRTSETTVSVDKTADSSEWTDFTTYTYNADVPVKNIILMIGDGMGENTIANAEIVKGDKLMMSGAPYKTHVTTNSLSGTTDSAASATAMSCGVKTYNQYIGIDGDKKDAESICEFAQARGLNTGLVATQIINHATPAGMIAHVDYRDLYNVILKQMINADIDVMLGGGSEYYTSKIEKLSKEHSYKYITTEEELNSLDTKADDKVLGLFSYGAMYAGDTPSLDTMAKSALDILSNKSENNGDNGFFLMIEGSEIDVQLSRVNMKAAMEEMRTFDKAIKVALDFASKNEGTLVIITADHETGGVIIPESKDKKDINNDCITSGGEHTNTNVALFAAGARADKIAENDVIDNTDIAKYMRQFLNETYGEKETLFKNRYETE